VWYPDSAAKTAQAIEEFGSEGLPLIILANWRGFSGGQRDLFEGVLQAGACIVEALRGYRRPVAVYLPPRCELRGGAWVVVDSQINAGMVEMFAGARPILPRLTCLAHVVVIACRAPTPGCLR
jgi:acetyl-CoA carboxylase / biotin carboxylase 1